MRQYLDKKLMGVRWPRRSVIAAGGFEFKVLLVHQPLVTQFVEATATDHEPLGCGVGIQLAGVESVENFLHEKRGSPLGQLSLFFMGRG